MTSNPTEDSPQDTPSAALSRLPPRAAAIRGDDYQHAIGWFWACVMLHTPDLVSVSIEDAGGGSFDDIVVRYRSIADMYIQAKSSNYNSTVVNSEWLRTRKTTKGRSPLKHFFKTYCELQDACEPFALELWTNRSFDPENPLLGTLLDRKSDQINTAAMLEAGPRTAVGIERDLWADHLAVGPAELAAFLNKVIWKHTQSELDWHQSSKSHMELAGLRTVRAVALITHLCQAGA